MDCTQDRLWLIPSSRWPPPGCHRAADGGQWASRCGSPWRWSACWFAGSPRAHCRSVPVSWDCGWQPPPRRRWELLAAHPSDSYIRCPRSPRCASPPVRCRSPRRSCPRRNRHLLGLGLSLHIRLSVRIVGVHIEIHIATARHSFRIIPVAGNARCTGHSRHIEGVGIFVLCGSADLRCATSSCSAWCTTMRQCIKGIHATSSIYERQPVELVTGLAALVKGSLRIGEEVKLLVCPQSRIEDIRRSVGHIKVPAAIKIGHIEVHRNEGHWLTDPERGQGAKDRRKGEALHCGSSLIALPAPQEAAVVEHVLGQRIQRPEIALARISRLTGHLDEAVVQTEIVPDGVLPGGELVFVVREAVDQSEGFN